MREAIEADVCRVICRFERLVSGSPDSAAIMRQVAVFCLKARYLPYHSLLGLLETYLVRLGITSGLETYEGIKELERLKAKTEQGEPQGEAYVA